MTSQKKTFLFKEFFSMASKPITIRWIKIDSQPDEKIMYSIELQTIFYKYQNKNHKINTNFVSLGLRPLKAYKTVFNLLFFHFDICGKLSIIRCDKYTYIIKECNFLLKYFDNLVFLFYMLSKLTYILILH